jgi:uncharacterized small protein (DUF1192 family)
MPTQALKFEMQLRENELENGVALLRSQFDRQNIELHEKKANY